MHSTRAAEYFLEKDIILKRFHSNFEKNTFPECFFSSETSSGHAKFSSEKMNGKLCAQFLENFMKFSDYRPIFFSLGSFAKVDPRRKNSCLMKNIFSSTILLKFPMFTNHYSIKKLCTLMEKLVFQGILLYTHFTVNMPLNVNFEVTYFLREDIFSSQKTEVEY